MINTVYCFFLKTWFFVKKCQRYSEVNRWLLRQEVIPRKSELLPAELQLLRKSSKLHAIKFELDIDCIISMRYDSMGGRGGAEHTSVWEGPSSAASMSGWFNKSIDFSRWCCIKIEIWSAISCLA